MIVQLGVILLKRWFNNPLTFSFQMWWSANCWSKYGLQKSLFGFVKDKWTNSHLINLIMMTNKCLITVNKLYWSLNFILPLLSALYVGFLFRLKNLKKNCERSKAQGDFSLGQKLDIGVRNLYIYSKWKNSVQWFFPRMK